MTSAQVKDFPGQRVKVTVNFTKICQCQKSIFVCDWISYEKGFMILVDEKSKGNVFLPYDNVMCIAVDPVDKDATAEKEAAKELEEFDF